MAGQRDDLEEEDTDEEDSPEQSGPGSTSTLGKRSRVSQGGASGGRSGLLRFASPRYPMVSSFDSSSSLSYSLSSIQY